MVEKQSSKSKGGKREGAGRKKGAPNKRTVETQALAQQSGITPLEYMLQVMRTSDDERMRMAAATAAAPYVHAKLSSIEMSGIDGGPVETVTRIEMVAMRGNSAD